MYVRCHSTATAIYEVLNSPFDHARFQWVTDARGVPRPAGRPSGSSGSSRHFIITFHDSTCERIADDIVGHTAVADLPPFPAE